MRDSEDISIGPYEGQVAPAHEGLIDSLATMPALLAEVTGDEGGGRNRVCRIDIEQEDAAVALSVKSFSSQNPAKDKWDRTHGSRASRSYGTALALIEAGVGTPPPVAFLDRWDGDRLVESYYVTEFQEDVTCLRDELIRLFREDPLCSKFMTLLERVAVAIKALHDAGIMHRDMGNQNIMMRRDGGADWKDVQFVDLNRARHLGDLALSHRAFDISRLAIPSDFLRVFKEMYFGDVPPDDFQYWESRYRKRFEMHTKTRPYRHPIRHLSQSQITDQQSQISDPQGRDMWVWDDRSVQAISPFTSSERRKYDSLRSHLRVAGTVVKAAPSIWFKYRSLVRGAFKSEVKMKDRIGMALSPTADTADQRIELLSGLGTIPVMLRFYHHETAAEWDFTADIVARLKDAGHLVSIALVQDRRAVSDRASWISFIAQVLDRVAGKVDEVELGHAINRSKWGLWDLDDYAAITGPVAEYAKEQPGTRFIGPACIDFEYPFAVAALKSLPEGFSLSGMSHHLYVDRRGAPENMQGSFSTMEKCAMGRAIARWAPCCEDRFVVSEVNWPVAGTGVYSPVGSPYVSPGPRYNDPSVSEEAYADYMVRYLLIAICSGLVDRVYWWRLVARGFGLVDDTDSGSWRKRPAYNAMQKLISVVGDSTFEYREMDEAGTVKYVFRTRGGQKKAITCGPEKEISYGE